VAEHGGMVQSGIFLRGPGRVALRNPRLSFAPAAAIPDPRYLNYGAKVPAFADSRL
jgi:hypothetical protein